MNDELKDDADSVEATDDEGKLRRFDQMTREIASELIPWLPGHAYAGVDVDRHSLPEAVRNLKEQVFKSQGMANEINILVRENRTLRGALERAKEQIQDEFCSPGCGGCSHCEYIRNALESGEGQK